MIKRAVKLFTGITFRVRDFIILLLPIKTMVSFFGIGYLPTWKKAWTAFFTVVFYSVVLQIHIGFSSHLLEVTGWFFNASLLTLVIGTCVLFLAKRAVVDYLKEYEHFTINVVVGQLLTISLTAPLIVFITGKYIHYMTLSCEKYILCADWFFYPVLLYVPAVLLIYFSFILVDIYNPWPSGYLDHRFKNPITHMLQSIVNALYTVIALYIIIFMVSNDFSIYSVLIYYEAVFRNLEIQWMNIFNADQF